MPAAAAHGNRLIDRLPRQSRLGLLANCEHVALAFGDVLCEDGRPYRYAHFPDSGFVSLVASVDGHPPLAIEMVGDEGMLGATLALGIRPAPLRAVVQGAGHAWRIPAAALVAQMNRDPALHRSLDRHLYLWITQLSQAALCMRFHEVEDRLARWLLMVHDRTHSDCVPLTHRLLADMLGVRRSAVTIAAGHLQARGLIHYRRGEIRILARPGLEAASCECYATLRARRSR